MIEKTLQIDVVKADSDEFDAQFIMSAASPDRVNDTIEADAYKSVARANKKLIALFNHNPDKPVGYWSQLRADGDQLKGYLKLSGTILGGMLKQLLADGVPLGASIGFRGEGAPNKKGGIHFTKIELLETSIVSIPAHPRALEIAKQFNFDLQSLSQVDDTAASGDNGDTTVCGQSY